MDNFLEKRMRDELLLAVIVPENLRILGAMTSDLPFLLRKFIKSSLAGFFIFIGQN